MKRLSILVCAFAIYLLAGGAALASGAGGIYGDEDEGTRTWYEKVFDFTINHWGADGFDEIEADVVIDLLRIASYDEDSALQIAHMPFLASVEPPDVDAMEALERLARHRLSDFQCLVSHLVATGGIPDGWERRGPGLANPALPVANWLLDEAYLTTWSYRLRRDQVSASRSNNANRWLVFHFGYEYNLTLEYIKLHNNRRSVIEIPLELVVYYEDGFIIDRKSVRGDMRLGSGSVGQSHNIAIPPSNCWPEGQYWVHLYHGEQKLAEVPYEVIP